MQVKVWSIKYKSVHLRLQNLLLTKFKMKKVLLFTILLLPFTVKSQNFQIDSLTNTLNTTKQNSFRVELFIKLSNKLAKEDSLLKFIYADSALLISENIAMLDIQGTAKKNMGTLLQTYNRNAEAVPYYESAISIFKKNENNIEVASINYDLGRIYYRLDNFQKSLDYHKKSLKIRKARKDTSEIIQSELAVAVMNWRMGKLKDSEIHYLISLALSEKTNNIQSILASLNSLGSIYWGYGNYSMALEYFERALKIALKTNSNRKYALIINNIGLIYREWGKNDKAFETYMEGLKVSMEEKYFYGLAYSYSNIGKIYLLNNEYKKALLNFDSALINYKKISKKIGVAFSYCNMGDSYLGMNNLGKAISYYKLSVKTAREINNKHHLALGLYSLANVYFESKKYNLANEAANESLQISMNQNYQRISKDNYFLLSKLAEISGSSNNALIYYKKASILQDSIFNEKSSKQFAEMQTKYETEKKELLLLKQQELINQSNVIIKQDKIQKYGLSIIILLLLVITIFVLRIRTRLKEKNSKLTEKYKEIDTKNYLLKQQKEEIEKINNELTDLTKLKELNTQIIVHDLKNPLNRIISSSKKRTTKSEHQLYESSQYMLNLVENILSVSKIEQTGLTIQTSAVNLQEIIQNAYESTDFLFQNKGVSFKTEMAANYKVLAENETLKRIFINLFTNAVKYTPSGGKITVSIMKNNDLVVIDVKDTGIGIKKEKIGKIFDLYEHDYYVNKERLSSTGIGLFFVKNAVEALYGEIQVKSKPNIGTSFIITLKIIEHIDKHATVTTSEIINNLRLEINEKRIIQKIVQELKNTELYEISSIKGLINQINPKTENLKSWVRLMNECVANYNTSLFQKLIMIADV
ncbi:MAG: tetratricopeptide repeat-containing sensor histidine kinase [Bacteroidota bacterium]